MGPCLVLQWCELLLPAKRVWGWWSCCRLDAVGREHRQNFWWALIQSLCSALAFSLLFLVCWSFRKWPQAVPGAEHPVMSRQNMDCCVQGHASKFQGNRFWWWAGWLEQRRGGLTQHMCLLYLISITERLNQDPHGMLLSQAFTHGGMSMVS